MYLQQQEYMNQPIKTWSNLGIIKKSYLIIQAYLVLESSRLTNLSSIGSESYLP